MKKHDVLLWIGLFLCPGVNAQSEPAASRPHGRDHSASFDLHAPVGDFGKSQFIGAGISYSWSHHRFGRDIKAKLLGLTFNGGGDYYLGKKVTIANNPFHYGDYLYLYAAAGLMANTGENGNISLTAGPAMGLYRGNSDWGWTTRLFGTYYFRENIAVGPGVSYKKQDRETHSLWTVSLRVSYIF